MYKASLETLVRSEEVTVRVLAYFLTDNVKQVYKAQVEAVVHYKNQLLETNFSNEVHELLQRNFMDSVLQKVMDEIVHARRRDREDLLQFVQRFIDAVRVCWYVFTPVEPVNS